MILITFENLENEKQEKKSHQKPRVGFLETFGNGFWTFGFLKVNSIMNLQAIPRNTTHYRQNLKSLRDFTYDVERLYFDLLSFSTSGAEN